MAKSKSIRKRIPKSGRSYTEVLLEAMQADFQAFGESLDGIDQKVTRRFNDVDKDLDHVKSELSLIRHELKQKVDRAEFKFLEARVSRIEATLKR